MSEFNTNDYVVLLEEGTKDYLLQIIDHKYTDDLYRVKILSTGLCGPVFKREIRPAKVEEIAVGHRINDVVPVYADVKFPYKVLTGEQVGAVMNATHFGCDLGDDFPIENHISPNCKVSD